MSTGGPRSKQYVWSWVEGGYNTCLAGSREEALEKAKKMGEPKGVFKGLTVNEKTFHVAKKGEVAELDKFYAGMFY